MAERVRLVCIAGAVCFLLAGGPARAAVVYGDLEFAVEPEPKGQALHGYTEYRILVRNRSSESTRLVTLTLPGDNWATGSNRANLRGISRSAEVGPGLTVTMTLSQPVLPDVQGSNIKVRIDGRLMERLLPLTPTATRAGGAMYGYPHRYGRRAYTSPMRTHGSGGNEPLVLMSMRVPGKFFQRTILPAPSVPPVPGAPPGAPAPGALRSPRHPFARRRRSAREAPSYTISAEFARADTPVSVWSNRWLAYTRYDGIAVTCEDLEELERGTNECRTVLQALWQFTQAGGVLLVLGPGNVSIPSAWKHDPLDRNGLTMYQVGFGQCLLSPDRDPQKWEGLYRITDRTLTTLREQGVVPEAVVRKVARLKQKDFAPREQFLKDLDAVLEDDEQELAQPQVMALAERNDRWTIVNSALSAAVMPWNSSRSLTDLNRTFPVVDDLGVPVKGLFALMILFAVALGPVNLVVLARKNKRIWMLWTVPALSMLTCMAVFGYMIVAEGWQGHARVGGVTLLDEIDKRATSLGRTAFYSPLTPGDGLRFGDDTEVQAEAVQDGGFGNSCMMDWTQGQHLAHGWVTARVPAHFLLRKSEPRRERLNIRRETDGNLGLVNALGADVKTLWVADEKGVLYQGGPIAAGERAVLKRSTRKPVKAVPAERWRQLYSRGDWIKPPLKAVDRPEDWLGPRTYLAVVDGSPFLEQALQGATVRESQSVVLGLMADLGGK